MKIQIARRGFSPSGGAEAYLRRFADGAAAAGHEIVLLSEQWPAEEWPHALIRIPSHSPRQFADALTVRRPRRPGEVLFSLERVWECDCYRAGDGVHASWLERRVATGPWWKRFTHPCSRKHRQILALEKALFTSQAGARMIIANSEWIRREIIERFNYPGERIRVVRNGAPAWKIDPSLRAQARRALGLGLTDFVVLFAGSGWERKGLRYALAALNAARLPKATFLVAGRGRTPGLPTCEQARFLGEVREMKPLLAAADVFLLPTIYDPFSNACLEAMSAGLPVITTAQNGFAELMGEPADGTVVGDARDVPGLTRALTAWSDADWREEARAQRGLQVLVPSIEQNVAQTLQVLQSLV